MQSKNMLPRVLAMAVAFAMTASQAWAHDLVNTQVPQGSLLGANVLDSGDWLAQSFTVSAPTQINSIMAYVLSSDSGNDLGKAFSIALYANNGANLPALNWNDAQQGQLFQAQAVYNGDGWNGLSNLNWSLGSGTYWLALEQSGQGNEASSLLLPTGAQPSALAVAFYSGGQGYAVTGPSDTFGLHVMDTPAVPEPDGLVLSLVGLGALGVSFLRARK